MGSRGNVYITSTAPTNHYTAADYEGGARGIYLYSHNDGHVLPEMVRQGLVVGEDRWGDPPYLTRILIDQIAKSSRDRTTGFGVSLTIADNAFPVTIVDIHGQTVSFASPGSEREPLFWTSTRSFADYVKAGPASYPSGVAG